LEDEERDGRGTEEVDDVELGTVLDQRKSDLEISLRTGPV